MTDTQANYVFLGPILTPNNNESSLSFLSYDFKFEQAIAIKGSDIVFVGSEENLKKKEKEIIGENTQIIKLSGDQIVMPGFQDGHVHPLAAGIRESRCSLEQAQSWEESLEMIQLYMESNPELEWITGSGWHWKWFSKERDGKPHAAILDQIIFDKPAVFRSYDGHNSWCNTAALKLAGLHENILSTFNCDHHIERHIESRFPTGLLHDEAMPLIYKLLPPLTLTQKLRGLELAIKKLYKDGITTFQDAMVRKSNLSVWLTSYGVTPNEEVAEVVKKLGTLPRASLCLLWELDSGFSQESALSLIDYFVKTRDLVNNSGKSDRIRAGTVKVMLDGTIESQTAFLHAPYLNTGGSVGSSLYKKEELCFMFTELDKLDFQIHVHAIGDATLTLALDAFECARKANPNGIHNRHHIAHLQLVDPKDIPRFKELNVVANFQPYWFLVDHDKQKVMDFVGPERYDHQYPLKSVMETGATIAFGSDYPFGSLDPIAGLHTAINHFHPSASLSFSPTFSPTSSPAHVKSVHNEHNFDLKSVKKQEEKDKEEERDNHVKEKHKEESCRGYAVFRPDQKISLKQALHYYTMGAAFVNYSEDVSGSLEVGKKADLIVLSNNIATMDQETISDTTVALTMANGAVVYKANK